MSAEDRGRGYRGSGRPQRGRTASSRGRPSPRHSSTRGPGRDPAARGNRHYVPPPPPVILPQTPPAREQPSPLDFWEPRASTPVCDREIENTVATPSPLPPRDGTRIAQGRGRGRGRDLGGRGTPPGRPRGDRRRNDRDGDHRGHELKETPRVDKFASLFDRNVGRVVWHVDDGQRTLGSVAAQRKPDRAPAIEAGTKKGKLVVGAQRYVPDIQSTPPATYFGWLPLEIIFEYIRPVFNLRNPSEFVFYLRFLRLIEDDFGPAATWATLLSSSDAEHLRVILGLPPSTSEATLLHTARFGIDVVEARLCPPQDSRDVCEVAEKRVWRGR